MNLSVPPVAGNKILLDPDDQRSCRLCIWKEARGEGLVGMAAVLQVIFNRVGKPGFGKTVHDVIYGKNQFSSMSVPTDPEFNLQPRDDDPSWLEAASIIVNQDETEDLITLGSLYYENPKDVELNSWFERNISGPEWKGLPDHALKIVIGKHYFFA